MTKSNKQPNPGSDEAVKLGCRCPVLDNAHGQGAYGTSGGAAVFWVNNDCPLHANQVIDTLGRGDSIN